MTESPNSAPTGPRLCKETCTNEKDDRHRSPGEAARLGHWLHRFEYHQPHGDQVDRYSRLRAAGRAMAELIFDLTPDSFERDRSLEALHQTIMLANAAIACNEDPAA